MRPPYFGTIVTGNDLKTFLPSTCTILTGIGSFRAASTDGVNRAAITTKATAMMVNITFV